MVGHCSTYGCNCVVSQKSSFHEGQASTEPMVFDSSWGDKNLSTIVDENSVVDPDESFIEDYATSQKREMATLFKRFAYPLQQLVSLVLFAFSLPNGRKHPEEGWIFAGIMGLVIAGGAGIYHLGLARYGVVYLVLAAIAESVGNIILKGLPQERMLKRLPECRKFPGKK